MLQPSEIRASRDDDLPAVTAIYAHHVLHGTGTFELDPPSLDDMRMRRAEVLGRGLPYLVAQAEGRVLGFAYGNWFKPRPAYRYSAENAIYVATDACGKGVGRQLLHAFVLACEGAGVRKLIAVIGDSANAASIAVHRSAGYTDVGVLKSCGWKAGAWRDVVLMERFLGTGDGTPAPGTA